MVSQDLVRGLSLLDQRGNDLVFLMEFPLCHVDATTGNLKLFKVFSVGCSGIVCIFVSNGAVADLFRAAIADIGCPVKAVAALFLKSLTCLITGRAGSAFDAAEEDLFAGIGLLTVIPVNAEVMGIIKGAFVIPVRQTVCFYLFRNGCWILAQKAGNIFKGSTFIQLVLYVDPIIKGKVFLIAGNIFTHMEPPSTAVRRKDNSTTFV